MTLDDIEAVDAEFERGTERPGPGASSDYLHEALCWGPVRAGGDGKTFLVECLACEGAAPVVKLEN